MRLLTVLATAPALLFLSAAATASRGRSTRVGCQAGSPSKG